MYDYGGRVNMLLGRARHIHKKDFLNISADSNPDYVSGCSMLISSKLFKQGFLFDPDYFLYWEDVDFCLRAKKKGFSVGLLDDVCIYHDLVPVSRRSIIKNEYLLMGNLTFIKKNVKNLFKPFAYVYWFFLKCKISAKTC